MPFLSLFSFHPSAAFFIFFLRHMLRMFPVSHFRQVEQISKAAAFCKSNGIIQVELEFIGLGWTPLCNWKALLVQSPRCSMATGMWHIAYLGACARNCEGQIKPSERKSDQSEFCLLFLCGNGGTWIPNHLPNHLEFTLIRVVFDRALFPVKF